MINDKENKVDELLREKLDGFELPVEDFVFDAIIEDLETTERPKRTLWFWFITLSGAIALFLGIFIFSGVFNASDNEGGLAHQSGIPTFASKAVNSGLFNSGQSNSDGAKLSDTSHMSTVMLPTPTSKPSQDNKSNQKRKSASTLTPAKAPTFSGNKNNVPSVLQSNKTQKYRATVHPLSIENHHLATPSPNNQPQKSQDNSQDAPPSLMAATSSSDNSNKPTEVQHPDTSSVQPTSHVPNIDFSKPDSLEHSIPLPSRPKGAKPLISLPDNLKDSAATPHQNIATTQTASSDTLQKSSKLSLQALVGFGVSYRTLKSPQNEVLEVHKNDHERFGLTYNTAFGIKYQFNRRMYAGIALGYGSFSERYAFHHDTINHTTTNTYNYWQVPLTFGIKVMQAKSLAVYTQFGLTYDYLRNAQSSWVDPNSLSAVSHSNNGSAHPFQNHTIQSSFGLDFSIKVTPKWVFNIVPSVSTFLNSVYIKSTNLNQKPYSGRLNVGLTRQF